MLIPLLLGECAYVLFAGEGGWDLVGFALELWGDVEEIEGE